MKEGGTPLGRRIRDPAQQRGVPAGYYSTSRIDMIDEYNYWILHTTNYIPPPDLGIIVYWAGSI